MAAPIEQHLPNEIQLRVLKSLPDFVSLHALTRASRSFYNVCKANKDSVLTAIYNAYIPSSLQQELVVLQCIQNLPLGRASLEENEPQRTSQLRASRVHGSTTISPPKPLSQDFIDDIRLQGIFNELTQDLATHIFRHAFHAGWTSDISAFTPSHSERIRIQRALYRIESWARLNQKKPVSEQHAQEALLYSLHPWELEEMGCVFDHFRLRLTHVIGLCVEAGLYGEERCYRHLFAPDIPPIRWSVAPHWSEDYIYQGLQQVLKILKAAHDTSLSNGDRLRRVHQMYPDIFPTNPTDEAFFSLTTALRDKPDEEIYLQHKRAPTHSEPSAAWRWSHKAAFKLDWYLEFKDDLAEWCAPLWDEDRIQAWGQLNGEWSSEPWARHGAQRRIQKREDRIKRMREDPNRPKQMPCSHGLNKATLPSHQGLLYYRGTAEAGDHEFSQCPLCFDVVSAFELTTGQSRLHVIRYGGGRGSKAGVDSWWVH